MSIWIEENGLTKLAAWNYKRTLITISRLVCWVEGTDYKPSFKPQNFGIAGGPIWTNYGISFKKEELKEIVDNMNDVSTLHIAYPDQYVNTNKNRCRCDCKTIEEEFEIYNNLIQNGPNSFIPAK